MQPRPSGNNTVNDQRIVWVVPMPEEQLNGEHQLIFPRRGSRAAQSILSTREANFSPDQVLGGGMVFRTSVGPTVAAPVGS
jgi:hypothetical protein